MYSKLPVGALLGSFIVARVSRLPVDKLWRRVKGLSGLSQREFLQYFSGAQVGVAVHIDEPSRSDRQVRLAELRKIWTGFHPPQGFRYVHADDLAALERIGIVSAATPPRRAA